MALVDMIPPAATGDFLRASGWDGAEVSPLAGDASFRRYFRVRRGGEVAVLMDAPPPHEDPRPFMTVAEYLTGVGLRAPRILHADLTRGLLLLEDFGDVQMRAFVDAAPQTETATYGGVVDVLIRLHATPPMAGLRVHGLDNWLDEVGLFVEWYGPAVGLALDGESFRAAWRDALAPHAADQRHWVTELRDFHAENIMLLDGASGLGHYGLLDFQDALLGHPAYDLVSMLQDARRDVTPSVEAVMLDRYMAATERDASFVDAYWALGGQRNTRILGVFCRLWKRDGKAHYTRFQPRMWGLLERDLAYPAMAPVRAWFDSNVPVEKRASFWTGNVL